MPRMRIRAAVLAIVVMTVAAFLPVVSADFLNYDDPQYVTGNQTVLKGLRVEGVLWALTTFDAANWHPLTWVSHMLDVSLFGLRAGPHHITNLALHTGSAVLLMLLLNGMTGAWWPSFLAAALFSIHPLRVESVAWISERKDVLSVLLFMVTMLAYLRYVKLPRAGRYLAIVAAFSLGLMTKPMLVTLPFVLLLLDWWPLGRFRTPALMPDNPRTAAWRPILEKLPLLLLAAVSSIVTFIAQQRGGAVIPTGLFPTAARIENAVFAYVSYIGKALLPHDLIPFYRHPGGSLSVLKLSLCLLLLASLTWLAVAARKRRPWLLTGWLWYLGMLIPVLGLVQVGLQGMADRYSYLPAVGLSLAITWEACARARRTNGGALALAFAAVAIIATLVSLTWRQSGHWKNTVTLFTRVVSVDPKNFSGFNMLGHHYLSHNEPARAAALFRRALEIWPSYQDSRFNLGMALAKMGEFDEAILQFEAVLRFNPRDAECLYDLGRVLVQKQRPDEALQRFEAALLINPTEPAILLARGDALARLGRIAEAVADFRRVVELAPTNAEARANLEQALRLMER